MKGIGLGIMGVAVLIAGYQLFTSDWQIGLSNSGTQTQAPLDPRLASTCVNVSAFPSWVTGDYCVKDLKGGVWTEIIHPPYHTNVGVYPFGPAEIKFFDYERNRKDNKLVLKEIATLQLSGDPKDTTCHPKHVAFALKMQEDGGARMRVGGQRSPQYAHCPP